MSSAQVGWSDPAFGANSTHWSIPGSQATASLATGTGETLLFIGHARTAGSSMERRKTRSLGELIHYFLRQSIERFSYAGIDAAAGRNLDLDDQILLGGDNGLRGYPLRYQDGTSRAVL